MKWVVYGALWLACWFGGVLVGSVLLETWHERQPEPVAAESHPTEAPAVVRYELAGDDVVCALVPAWRELACVKAWNPTPPTLEDRP